VGFISFCKTINKSFLQIEPQQKGRFLVGGYFLFSACYFFTGYVHFYPPQVFPLLYWDHSIPFLPWTIVLYTSQWIFLPLPYFLLKKKESLTFTFQAMLLASLFSFFCFLCYPVWPPPCEIEDLEFLWRLCFRLLEQLDRTTNTFPSLHVSLAFIASMSVFQEKVRGRFWILIWGFCISISTVTTKRHYVLDVLGGIFVALGSLGILSLLQWRAFRCSKSS
jgi:membrane-associated phospholipid phosphatase